MALLEVLQLVEIAAQSIRAWRLTLIASLGAAIAAVTLIVVPNIVWGITLGAVCAVLSVAGGLYWHRSAAKLP